jgi:hypothetical protein
MDESIVGEKISLGDAVEISCRTRKPKEKKVMSVCRTQIAREWVMLNICIFAIARADITKPTGSFFIYFFIAPTIRSIMQFSQQSWLLVYLQ